MIKLLGEGARFLMSQFIVVPRGSYMGFEYSDILNIWSGFYPLDEVSLYDAALANIFIVILKMFDDRV